MLVGPGLVRECPLRPEMKDGGGWGGGGLTAPTPDAAIPVSMGQPPNYAPRPTPEQLGRAKTDAQVLPVKQKKRVRHFHSQS